MQFKSLQSKESTIEVSEVVDCVNCEARPSQRLCSECLTYECDECFESLHAHGHRKRHMFRRVVLDDANLGSKQRVKWA